MVIRFKEQSFVIVLYFFAITGLLLSIIENVPFKGILNKIQYMYMGVSLFFLIKRKIFVWNRKLFFFFAPLLLHTFLFGKVFVNAMISGGTRVLFKNLLVMYLFVLVSAIYFFLNGLEKHFLFCSYAALSVQTMWCALTHIRDFVNPIYFVNIFSRYERFRAHFGYGDVNFCGTYCVNALVLATIILIYFRHYNIKVGMELKIGIILISLIQICMLFSTASRSGILSFLLFCGTYFTFSKSELIRDNWKKILPIVLLLVALAIVVLSLSGIVDKVWGESNREGNFSINYPIFKHYFNYMTGMGYMDNAGFLSKAYGYETTAMDVYYLYILFSTGIIGAVIISVQMLYVLINLLLYKRSKGRNAVLGLYVMMLFYAIWQVNYLNARYSTGIIQMIILCLFFLNICDGKRNCFYKLK